MCPDARAGGLNLKLIMMLMQKLRQALVVAACVIPALVYAEAAKSPSVRKLTIDYGSLNAPGESVPLSLKGAGSRQQLLATAECADGLIRDLTHAVIWESSPREIVKVTSGGLVTPFADGEAVLTARSSDGVAAQLKVKVQDAKIAAPMNFANQVVPIFTKLGCNAGGCHGKSGGQNGFRLSLLGFEPAEDMEHLVKESRGRRLFPAAPDQSLLLLKAVGTLPHGGGKRLEPDSRDYQVIRRWIAQGMPYGKPEDPTVTSIEVYPKERTMERSGDQQLVVTARYSDGSTEDVTAGAQYDSNDKDIAQVDAAGRVKIVGRAGDVAVMIRYQSQVAVFRAAIPLGAEVAKLPPVRNFVDELVFKKLKAVGMPPSDVCDDATFIRRATIDIAGRLPSSEETKRFLADKHPSKREYLIDSLLDSPDYAEYFANKWSALLRNKRGTDTHARANFGFYNWIRDSFLENKPYNEFVSEILTASGDMTQNPPATWYRQVRDTTSQLEDSAQLFMATRMKCAQCHHHPFEKWSQDDYFSLGAFFTQVGRKPGDQPGDESIYHKRGVAMGKNAKTNAKLKPAPLGGKPLDLAAEEDPRQALADWLGARNNPFLAKALINRYWKHFFNRALVEPEDDIRDTNPPSNPELFDALARHFVDSGFDLKDLVRTITRSSAYQLSSIPNEFNAQDKQFFSRYYPKRLTAEVLLDAINEVSQSQTAFAGTQEGTKAVQLPDNSYNASSYFLTVFGRPDATSSCECERSQDASLAQSLHLLNSKDIQAKLSAESGRAAKLATDLAQPDERKIEELYYSVFSRAPKADEVNTAIQHVSKRSTATKEDKEKLLKRREAYEDILWALMSSKEFLFNH
jgi:hypothetical protein